ncbi:MAG: lysophospholipid acyltransferase family protein [Campylobacterales bacterium]|nr:lysophospholipid acyltransferase family protein [Campylobacterales bacterium]
MRLKQIKKSFVKFLFPPIGYFFIWILFLSCKKRYYMPILDEKPIIVTFWHGELLMQPFLYKKIKNNGKIALLISEHFDGEIIAKTMKFFGFESIRGSSRKGAVKSLIGMIKKVKDGYDLAITPDGPKGPRYSIADGVIAVAQKSGARIVVFNYRVSKFWQLNSWDKFLIPKPFSTIEFFASEPIDVSNLEIEQAKNLLKNKMLLNAI